VDVVFDLEEAVSRWVGVGNGIVPDVLAGLDLGRAVVQIPLRVKVEIYYVVAEGREYVLAVPLADGIRGSGEGPRFN
jgi:hypothetical protein